jgi:hypothetical protein
MTKMELAQVLKNKSQGKVGTVVVVVVSLAAVIVGALVVKKLIKTFTEDIDVAKENTQLDITVKGVSPLFDVQGYARAIHDSFYHDTSSIMSVNWFGFHSSTEDEERAIMLINKVPDQYVQAVSNAYSLYSDTTHSTGKNMKSDFLSYLDDEKQIAQVQAKLNLIK